MTRIAKVTVLAVLLALLGGAFFWAPGRWSSPPPSVAWFEDKTAGAGLHFTYRNGEEADHFTMLETLGGGVGLLDYDRDGLLDIFVTGGGHFGAGKEILGYANRLYRNEGGWRFRDVTAEAGLPADGMFYSHGCAVGDYDNDGWADVLVTGYGRLALFQNRNGKFTEVTKAAGLVDAHPRDAHPREARARAARALHWSTSAAWADLTGDGRPDVFVCHYLDWSFANNPVCRDAYSSKARDVCSPDKFQPLAPALFVNQGDGTFKEASAGLAPGKGLGVAVFDADNDGRPDVYVANDLTGNNLYLNRGAGNFEDAAVRVGVAYSMHGNRDGSMGLAVGDYDRSGLPSVFVTNFQGQVHSLFRNLGNGFYQHSQHLAGLSAAIDTDRVGWGTGFFDFDLDGGLDLFIVHGHILRYPAKQPSAKQRPALFRNLGKAGDKPGQARFEHISDRGGAYFRADHAGRGVAFGDLDNDGGIDVVINHVNEPVTLLRNQVEARGQWLGIELTGKVNRDAVGAKLTLEANGQALTQFVLGGGSYLSSSDRRVVFGLGKMDAAAKLTVRWPSGQSQTWAGKDFVLGQYHRLLEGEPRVEVVPAARAKEPSIEGGR